MFIYKNMILYTNAITSLLFLTNTFRLYFKSNLIYFYSFLLLTISSIVHHSLPHIVWLGYLDRLLAGNVVYQGGSEFYHYLSVKSNNLYSINSIITICTFFLVAYLYGYGYFSKTLCFDKNPVAYLYHSLVHVYTTIGHHSIISML